MPSKQRSCAQVCRCTLAKVSWCVCGYARVCASRRVLCSLVTVVQRDCMCVHSDRLAAQFAPPHPVTKWLCLKACWWTTSRSRRVGGPDRNRPPSWCQKIMICPDHNVPIVLHNQPLVPQGHEPAVWDPGVARPVHHPVPVDCQIGVLPHAHLVARVRSIHRPPRLRGAAVPNQAICTGATGRKLPERNTCVGEYAKVPDPIR